MNVDKSTVTGESADPKIHSAIIKNQTSAKIHCYVEYRTTSGSDNEVVEFDVNDNEEHKCEEKVHSASNNTHNSSSSFSTVFPKVIYSLQVQKSDGSKLKIASPFDHVPRKDVRNWKFIVDNDKIHSESS